MHGIGCPCSECERTREFLRNGIKSGKIHFVATEEDKRKLWTKR
jgi:hypothetical protein